MEITGNRGVISLRSWWRPKQSWKESELIIGSETRLQLNLYISTLYHGLLPLPQINLVMETGMDILILIQTMSHPSPKCSCWDASLGSLTRTSCRPGPLGLISCPKRNHKQKRSPTAMYSGTLPGYSCEYSLGYFQNQKNWFGCDYPISMQVFHIIVSFIRPV